LVYESGRWSIIDSNTCSKWVVGESNRPGRGLSDRANVKKGRPRRRYFCELLALRSGSHPGVLRSCVSATLAGISYGSSTFRLGADRFTRSAGSFRDAVDEATKQADLKGDPSLVYPRESGGRLLKQLLSGFAMPLCGLSPRRSSERR
jgi:hypothetical protein